MHALIADIGATNARFAINGPNGVVSVRVLSCEAFTSINAAISAYLAQIQPAAMPVRAAISIAAVVNGDTVSMTNHGWSFSINNLRRDFGFAVLHVVNDFTAIALSIPRLTPADMRQIGSGTIKEGAPIAVLGAGTGLGVSGLIPSGHKWIPLAGEGGHVTLAATNQREAAILEYAQRLSHTGHVSGEFLLCGKGLERLYECIAHVDGITDAPGISAAEISQNGCNGSNPCARATIDQFCCFLGNVAGNLALTLGSFGGVYLAGGILPRWGGVFDQSPFRNSFINKGRYQAYMDSIPTFLITHPFPAFPGLELLLDQG